MKIAIHHRVGSYSDQWIKYCKENQVPYKKVNCYDSDIISQLDDCSGLMWHWDSNDYKAKLCARQISLSCEKKGIKVFPDVNTSWHYDDKVGQKYLLEAIEAPLVQSYVFYSKKDALKWIQQASFPKVFKLRGGAGSVNVKLVKTRSKAKKLIKKAFGRGFPYANQCNTLQDDIIKTKKNKSIPNVIKVIKSAARIFIPTELRRFSGREKGYIYFQDFIEDKNYDNRIVVIGNRCFGSQRYVREGDFRASGSGDYSVNPELINIECVKIAFDVSKKLKSQTMAFDFINDNGEYKIIEISYCMPAQVANESSGYWDKTLQWHNERVKYEYFFIKDFIDSMDKTKTLNETSM